MAELEPEIKIGARNSAKDGERLQKIHDLAVENGADCPMPEADMTKAIPSKDPGDYLVVEDKEKPSTFHLQVSEGGKPNHRLMGAAFAALHKGYRGNQYEGPDKDKAISKLNMMYAAEGMGLPSAGKSESEPQAAEGEPAAPKPKHVQGADELLISFGGAVKAVSDREIEGYLVRFGNENEPDLSPARDWFYPQTYFGKNLGVGVDVTLNHGIPLGQGLEWAADTLPGHLTSVKADDYGLLARAVIEANDAYRKTIMDLVRKGKLHWSSGAVAHLVKRTEMGNGTHRVDRWVIGEAALTPTPAEPRLPAILPLKSYQSLNAPSAEASPQASGTLEAGDAVAGAAKTNVTEQQVVMEDRMNEQEQKDFAALKDRQAAQAKELAELKAKFDAPPTTPRGGLLVPKGNGLHQTPLGDDAFKAFGWYLKTGDPSGIRTGTAYEQMQLERHWDAMKTTYNLLESTQYQGQEAVPTEVLRKITEKRDPISIVRAAGAAVDQVGSNAAVLPIEKASPEIFAITTVDASATFDQTTVQPLDKVSATIYLFTRSVPIDIQLIDDAVFNIENWWSRRVARAWALTENKYFSVGTGSSQPQGAVVGGTSGKTSASASAVTAAEVLALYHALPMEYRDRVSWMMTAGTEGTVRGLGAPSYGFAFVGNASDMGAAGNMGIAQGNPWMVDPRSKVFNAADMDAIAASKKPILVGNFEAGYQIFERKTLTVFRDPFTLASKGLVQVLAYFRETGAVSNATALQYLATPSA